MLSLTQNTKGTNTNPSNRTFKWSTACHPEETNGRGGGRFGGDLHLSPTYRGGCSTKPVTVKINDLLNFPHYLLLFFFRPMLFSVQLINTCFLGGAGGVGWGESVAIRLLLTNRVGLNYGFGHPSHRHYRHYPPPPITWGDTKGPERTQTYRIGA